MSAKLNEGDIMEGIFCLATGLLLAYDKVDKNALNKLRKQIDPKNFVDGKETVVVVKDRLVSIDKETVTCVIRLKSKTTTAAFGKDYKILYENQQDVGGIDGKINTIVSAVNNTSFASKLLRLKRKYLKNDQVEDLIFTVTANGIAGESGGGLIKGDVLVNFDVRDAAGKKIGEENMSYSIKSGSKTISNLGPYRGMMKMAEAFGVKSLLDRPKMNNLKKLFSSSAKTATEKEAVLDAIRIMFKDIATQAERVSKTDPNFSKKAFAFIKKEIFGSDLADLIDIRDGKIKEITQQYINNLAKTTKLIIRSDPESLKVVDKNNPKSMLYSMRLKISTGITGVTERKFYIEAGPLLYGKK